MTLGPVWDTPRTSLGHPYVKFWTIRRSPYKIDHFRGIPKAFDAFFKVSTSSEHVRQNLVAVWSAPEKSATLSYFIGYLNFFPENLCVRQMANLCGAHM